MDQFRKEFSSRLSFVIHAPIKGKMCIYAIVIDPSSPEITAD